MDYRDHQRQNQEIRLQEERASINHSLMIRAFMTVSSWTFVSRILGYVRDSIVAAALGTGPLAEVFLIAFRLPNFFRRIFAEGAFSAAFVPHYTAKREKDGEEAAHRFASQAFSWMLGAMLVLVLVVQMVMPWFLYLITPGFADEPEKFDLAVLLSRITFPYLLFITLVALLGGMLNSIEKYAAFAAMPVILNVTMIAGVTICAHWFQNEAYALSWAIAIAGLLQLLWMMVHAIRYRIMPRLEMPRITEDIKQLWRKFLPGIFGSSIVQLNIFIDTIIATFIAGAVAFLYYADRVSQLPLSLVGTALSITLLPTLSRAIANARKQDCEQKLNDALLLGLGLSVPAMFGLLALSFEIVALLFGYGKFTDADVEATAFAMMAYGFGMPAFVLVKVISTLFFAHQDTRTPVILSLISMGANLVMNISFVLLLSWIGWHPHVGLALATSLAAYLQVIMLVRRAKQKGYVADIPLFSPVLCRTYLAAFLPFVALLLVNHLAGHLWQGDVSMRLVTLIQIMLVGGVYAALILKLKVVQVSQLKAMLSRRKQQ